MRNRMKQKNKGKYRSKNHINRWQYAKMWRLGITPKQIRERKELEVQGDLAMGEIGKYYETKEEDAHNFKQ